MLTLDLENTRFFGGPPNATFDLSGRLLLDTRTGSTAWSQNNALIVRDYLTAEWGFNCLASDIDVAYCNAAANACDVPISLTIGAGTVTNQPTYTCNGSFNSAESREAVLADLCESMAGYATYGAKWLIQAGAWTVPVRALTDDDLDGQIEIVQGGAGMDEIFNSVRGSYVPLQSSVVSDFDVYQNAAFLAADGRALYTDITLPFTNNKARCRNLARVFTERNRDSQIIRYPAKLSAFPLQIGERVTVTSGEYGLMAKEYRITDWQFGITAPVQLLLQEDSAGNYDLADAATSDPAANTALPNPYLVSALSGVAATSGTTNQLRLEDNSVQQRVRVSWTAITDPWLTDGSGFVYVQWRRQYRDPANVWQTVRVPASEVQAYIPAVAIGDALTIAVWAENGLKIRGPSVYASVVVSGTAQLVTTPMLGAGAATNVQSVEPADGTVSWPGNPTVNIGNPNSAGVFSLAYTNNTGRVVSMEMTCAMSAYQTGGGGGPAGVTNEMRASWAKTVAGTSSTKKYTVQGTSATTLDSMSYSSAVTLNAGDTLTFSGTAGGYNATSGLVPAGSVTWSNATARLTAVLV